MFKSKVQFSHNWCKVRQLRDDRFEIT